MRLKPVECTGGSYEDLFNYFVGTRGPNNRRCRQREKVGRFCVRPVISDTSKAGPKFRSRFTLEVN